MNKENLNKDLEKLIKQANQRIYRIEKATGIKEGYAIRTLASYLSMSPLNLWTKKGRIKNKKDLDSYQEMVVRRIISRFLENKSGSTLRGIKKAKKQVSEEINLDLDYEQYNTIYQYRTEYKFIYDYIPESEFWKLYGNPIVQGKMSKDEFIDDIVQYITDIPDDELKMKLSSLYDYIKKG